MSNLPEWANLVIDGIAKAQRNTYMPYVIEAKNLGKDVASPKDVDIAQRLRNKQDQLEDERLERELNDYL